MLEGYLSLRLVSRRGSIQFCGVWTVGCSRLFWRRSLFLNDAHGDLFALLRLRLGRLFWSPRKLLSGLLRLDLLSLWRLFLSVRWSGLRRLFVSSGGELPARLLHRLLIRWLLMLLCQPRTLPRLSRR